MTDKQANDIIDNCIKAHWPNWNFVGQEIVVWIQQLRKYDYEKVKAAINELYLTWEKERYPKAAHIFGAIKRYSKSNLKHGGMVALFGIFQQDGTQRGKNVYGPKDWPKEEVEAIAKRTCKKCNDIYGGQHYYQIYADIPI